MLNRSSGVTAILPIVYGLSKSKSTPESYAPDFKGGAATVVSASKLENAVFTGHYA